MTLPAQDTIVSYPDGATSSVGTVVHVERLGDGSRAVLLDRTAFHPVDTAWPDQPSDAGILRVDGAEFAVTAVTGGTHEGRLHVGADLPVRMGTEGWTFTVLHVVSPDDQHPIEPGMPAAIEVDQAHRRALSAGHTGCHLASLALDSALREAWSKPVPTDALGHPAFDQLAIARSRIVPHGSIDDYRIGKSLRRKGFVSSALDDLDGVSEHIRSTLTAWVAEGAAVHIEREDEAISARRRWVCHLAQGPVGIPCGGTHLTSLAEIDAIDVSLSLRPVEGGQLLQMETRVTLV